MTEGSVRAIFFAEIAARKADSIVCIKEKTYATYHQLFTDITRNDIVSNVEGPARFNDDAESPHGLRMRFIRFVLANGEVEVLATSLLDQKRYPLEGFKKL